MISMHARGTLGKGTGREKCNDQNNESQNEG